MSEQTQEITEEELDEEIRKWNFRVERIDKRLCTFHTNQLSIYWCWENMLKNPPCPGKWNELCPYSSCLGGLCPASIDADSIPVPRWIYEKSSE